MNVEHLINKGIELLAQKIKLTQEGQLSFDINGNWQIDSNSFTSGQLINIFQETVQRHYDPTQTDLTTKIFDQVTNDQKSFSLCFELVDKKQITFFISADHKHQCAALQIPPVSLTFQDQTQASQFSQTQAPKTVIAGTLSAEELFANPVQTPSAQEIIPPPPPTVHENEPEMKLESSLEFDHLLPPVKPSSQVVPPSKVEQTQGDNAKNIAAENIAADTVQELPDLDYINPGLKLVSAPDPQILSNLKEHISYQLKDRTDQSLILMGNFSTLKIASDMHIETMDSNQYQGSMFSDKALQECIFFIDLSLLFHSNLVLQFMKLASFKANIFFFTPAKSAYLAFLYLALELSHSCASKALWPLLGESFLWSLWQNTRSHDEASNSFQLLEKNMTFMEILNGNDLSKLETLVQDRHKG